jgi:hypothetical protein
MSDGGETAGGCFALVGLLLLVWVPFHFSGFSILFGRTEGRYSPDLVWAECLFLNSTGVEKVRQSFITPEWRDRFYCPRYKKVGQWPNGA